MVIEMRKTNVKQGKRYQLATHVNEILLPREEAESIEAFYVIIEPGKYTHSHSHADTEQLYYIIGGTGRVVFKAGETEEFDVVPEDVVHVPRGTEHQVFCTSGEEPLTYLCVDGFPLGKPEDEPTWDDHYRAVVKLQEGA